MTKVSKKEPLISIVVPVYKVEEYIDRCIQSITNQTYENIEIILVDDGSPDNCGKICDSYAKKDKRIKVIHKENGGLSDARNAGIEKANGKYISFIDSDDYIEKDYIKILYKAIDQEDIDIAIGSHTVLYDTGAIIKKATGEEKILEPKEVLERILYDDNIDYSAWAKLYKMELFNEIRYPKGRVFEDAATTYRVIDISRKIAITSKPIYNYIIRSDSISNAKFSLKKMDLITSTEEMCNYIKEKYPTLESACNRRLMWAYLSTLSQLAMCKDKYPREQKQMTTYIKNHGLEQLKDKRVPKRDKMGIVATMMGFGFYKFMWNTYRKITGRK